MQIQTFLETIPLAKGKHLLMHFLADLRNANFHKRKNATTGTTQSREDVGNGRDPKRELV